MTNELGQRNIIVSTGIVTPFAKLRFTLLNRSCGVTNMFVGREYELNVLNKRFNSGRFEFIPIYGRRRVGKTALIREFVKDKKAVFFTATESGGNRNLRGLSSAIYETASGVQANLTYSDYEAALDAVFDIAVKEKLVFVIDEYPYLAESYSAVSSILQMYIDQKYKDTDLFLILCGSSMSFMENQVLGYKSPLYGRRTGQLRVAPFDFRDSSRFHKSFSKEEQAVIYGITGGIPKYLEMMDDKRSLKENIIGSFLTADSMLFEEPSNLLKQELREPQTYNDILTAIADGSSRMNEIVTKTGIVGFDSSKCNKYLRSLISLDLVKRELPAFEPNSKKSIYRVKDGMFRFLYRFVATNVTSVQLGLGDAVYKRIEPHIPAFMGEVFEEICKQWLWGENIANRLPFSFRDFGRWWGTDPVRKQEAEVDILAADDVRSSAILCECKWTNDKVDGRVVRALLSKAELFNFGEKYFLLFSRSGFKDDAKKMANDRIRLVEFSDMYA